ncbi:hypothetical protein S40285_10388 [Stachybotrys chlorohalonatus IBT 40285]|uniref:Uncharacterized protein n=1 Tax=Stachybotrys chlorohalonatus (strain IBT 40285) TaxID=1283841 RepID=A0A084QER2_STAC4|nr:hypothetical protein S40285_10388 [Stachybotrys chlorohalonata IBT 40285]
MSTDSRSSCCNVCTESSTHVDATALRLDRIYLKKLRYLLEDYVWLESVVGPDHTAFLHEPMGHHTNIFHGLIGRHDRLKWLLNQSHLWGPFGPETTMGAWWGSMLAEMEQATAARDALWEEFREEFEGEAQMTGERMPEPTWHRIFNPTTYNSPVPYESTNTNMTTNPSTTPNAPHFHAVNATSRVLTNNLVRQLEYLCRDFAELEATIGHIDRMAGLYRRAVEAREQAVHDVVTESRAWGPFGPESTTGRWLRGVEADMRWWRSVRDVMRGDARRFLRATEEGERKDRLPPLW